MQVAAGDELARPPSQGRGVDAEGHGQHRLVDDQAGQRLGVGRRGEGVADLHLGIAGDDEQVARLEHLGIGPGDAREGQHLARAAHDRGLADLVLLGQQSDGLAGAQRALHDPTDSQPPEVVGRVEVGDEGLQGRVRVTVGRGDVLEHRIQDRRQVRILRRQADADDRPALAGHRGDDRERELLGVGGEVDEQLLDLVQHLGGAGIGPVELVEHHHRREVPGQRFREHVAGLGQRSLGRVDQQQHAVDQGERPLDLTAEVGVARRVDEVDLDALPHHRGGLGEDGDAPLALLVAGVHHPIDQRLVGGEDPRGAQQPIHQGGLAMVDVRDERDVAERHQELSSGDGSRAAVRQEPCYTSSSSSSSKGTLYFSAKAAYSSSSSVS